MARYSLERCLCQFKYVQGIPRPFPIISYEGINRWFLSNIVSSVITIKHDEVGVYFPRQCEDGCLKWYIMVSHHRLILLDYPIDDVRLSHDGGPLNDMRTPPLPSPDMTDQ